MRLIAITPFSRFEEDTILIGVNCIDEMNIQNVREHVPQIINPYTNHDDLLKAAEYCWSLSLDACYNLGKTLNNIHGVSYGPSYWKVLLLPWMSAFVEQLYDRYLRLCWVRENCPNAVIEIPNMESLCPLYGKSFDVLEKAHFHSTNIIFYSFLIEAMGLGHNVKSLSVDWNEVQETVYGVKKTSSSLKNIVMKLIKSANIHKGHAIFWDYLNKHGTGVFSLSRKMGWFQLGVPSLQDEGFSQQTLDRRKITFAYSNSEFKNILQGFIPDALPVSFFEEYCGRRNTSLKFLYKKKTNTMFISNTLWVNDTLKFLMAELRDKDGKIVGRQHGGGYGHYVITTVERVEREISDYFITWGWDDERHCPTVPLPAPKLSDIANTHYKNDGNMLFIGTHAPMYMYRYQSYWIPEFVYFKYYPMKQIFFQELKESVKKHILYRPYGSEYGWNERKRIQKMLPHVIFDISSPIQTMKTCSLVVIDHPSTSFLEALVINVPTIIFWDDEQCPMREEAKPYFQLLIDAGILYYNPADAAKKVNEIANEPEIWWANGIVQSARKEFCDRFAWADPKWEEIWAKNMLIP